MAVNKQEGENLYYCPRKCGDILKGNRIRKGSYSDLNEHFGIIYKFSLTDTLNSRFAFILLVKVAILIKKVLQSLFISSHFN